MANKIINSRIQMKHDTSANWALATTFVPLAGEVIVYSDLNKFKIGDGTNTVVDLPFAGGTEILANGILKGDGAGNISAAVAGTDYQAPLPEVSNNKYLHTNASTGALEWSEVDALPSQSGQSGKFLTTNGTTASWAEITNFPVISQTTGTLAAGNTTATVNYTGTFVNAFVKDSAGNEVVAEIKINASNVVFEIAAALAIDLTCVVMATSTSVGDGNEVSY